MFVNQIAVALAAAGLAGICHQMGADPSVHELMRTMARSGEQRDLTCRAGIPTTNWAQWAARLTSC